MAFSRIVMQDINDERNGIKKNQMQIHTLHAQIKPETNTVLLQIEWCTGENSKTKTIKNKKNEDKIKQNTRTLDRNKTKLEALVQ